jgi:hypothetical protein
MRNIEIKLPRSIAECTPDMIAKWSMLAPSYGDKEFTVLNKLEFYVQLVSIFSGVPISTIRRVDIDSIAEASEHILTMLNEFTISEPIGRVEIDGQAYVFDKDSTHWTTGQIIDMKLIDDTIANPCEALAIMYIEEGMEYCQMDHREHVLNPTEKRAALFKKSFPGDESFNFYAFFLRDLDKRKLAILTIQSMKVMKQRKTLEMELSEIANGSHGLN